MESFIGNIKGIGFIGDADGPPPGQVSWDANTPWDDGFYWS